MDHINALPEAEVEEALMIEGQQKQLPKTPSWSFKSMMTGVGPSVKQKNEEMKKKRVKQKNVKSNCKIYVAPPCPIIKVGATPLQTASKYSATAQHHDGDADDEVDGQRKIVNFVDIQTPQCYTVCLSVYASVL